MSDDDLRSDDARENFTFFSNEYAQALQALKAIEEQSPTLLVLGGSTDLRAFVDRFIEMATKTMNLAEERGETNFAEWFRELVGKAAALRGAIAER
jgi:dihydrofolate reductase